MLLATYLPESLLMFTPDGRLLNSGGHVILSAYSCLWSLKRDTYTLAVNREI